MSVPTQLPLEWETLPAWVKDELINGSEDLSFYSGYIHRLVAHGENMKAVWRMFESHTEGFQYEGRVHSLVGLLHYANHGPDPGYTRSGADRRSIASDVRKHVDALLKLTDRLGTGGGFGMYPLGVTEAIILVDDAVSANVVERLLEPHMQAFLAHTDGGDVPTDTKNFIVQQLEYLQTDLELEVLKLTSDPRPSLRALADATSEWARTCGWERNDAICRIGDTLKVWFGCSQLAATATLATAVLDEEISVDVVAGVLKRHARHIS